MSRASYGKLLLLVLLLAAVAGFFLFDFGAYLTLDVLKARQAELASLVKSGRSSSSADSSLPTLP
jgi:hypothetical protein